MTVARTPIAKPNDSAEGLSLLTVEEAYKRLRISRWSFYRLIQQGQITTIRIGRRRFVPVSAITAFIEQRSEEAA